MRRGDRRAPRLRRVAVPLGGLLEAELVEQRGEELAVFGEVDAFGEVPMIGTPCCFEAAGEVERRLAAELHDDAVRLLLLADVEHVLERQRLEEELVAGVVVGARRSRGSS